MFQSRLSEGNPPREVTSLSIYMLCLEPELASSPPDVGLGRLSDFNTSRPAPNPELDVIIKRLQESSFTAQSRCIAIAELFKVSHQTTPNRAATEVDAINYVKGVMELERSPVSCFVLLRSTSEGYRIFLQYFQNTDCVRP